jgi:hypothetical protein
LEARDLIVTPLLLMIIYTTAYFVRPFVTDEITRRYFFPALTVKIIGALAVGFIYQFYYDGGDTFNYHTHGSRHIVEAFWESPEKGVKLFLSDGADTQGVYRYASRIMFLGDPSSYAIVKLAAIFDLFTFSTYSATAVLFAIFSFVGMWLFFLTFYKQFSHLHRGMALASFFIPSVFFWGSGLLKDTITLGCLGIAVYTTYRTFIERRLSVINLLFMFLSFYGLYVIKIYIILTFLPAAIFWIFMCNFSRVRLVMVKVLLFPIVMSASILLAYFAIAKTGEGDKRYSLVKIAETAQITAYDIGFYTGRNAGSGYSLGELDGSFMSMVKLGPQAINVSLFRPYLWEVRNPLMLLSAMESSILFVVVLALIFRYHVYMARSLLQPNILFLMVFALAFSFAVGVSTYNFGTLVRYKIPMLPFFVVALTLIQDSSKSLRKLAELESVE